jgi:MFS family permease
MTQTEPAKQKIDWRSLPRNVWAVSLTSFFMDVSSEMVINILPLFLSNVLGVKTNIIGLIEGIAEATASLLKVFSGWLSDRIGERKWLAVAGYGISMLAKPFFYFANAWTTILAVRFSDRVGKGIRTAPRDALVADSIDESQRGLAFGFHRAADTGGAVLGLIIALGVVWASQSASVELGRHTFQVMVLVSLIPAVLAVISLALGAENVPVTSRQERPAITFRGLGRPFLVFMLIVGIFDLGNSSDAFLVLRAQERGLSVLGIMGMLITFNLVYTLVSTPAGSLSDRVGRSSSAAGWPTRRFTLALPSRGGVGTSGRCTPSTASTMAWPMALRKPWWPTWCPPNCGARPMARITPCWVCWTFPRRSSPACCGRAWAAGRALVPRPPSSLGPGCPLWRQS